MRRAVRPCSGLHRAIAAGTLAAGFLVAAATGHAAIPSTTPMARVDAPMHTAGIGQMRADAQGRVVTVSSDRTVRVWQLPALRLVRVLRLPQEGTVEGLPVGLAISPDGSRIAVGGWTGKTWESSTSIYLFDVASGRLLRRIGGFQDLIAALDWSPDGRRLAVGLAGRRGVQVLDTQTWTAVAQDPEYADSVTFLHFSAQGMLAAAAADGSVRLYDAAHKLVGRQAVGVSRLLGGVRFSPDGLLLALGVIDRPLALVLKVPTLELAAQRQVPDPLQKGLCCIAWSRDGKSLFVNGAHGGDTAVPLYRFDGRGLGPLASTLPVGDQTVTNMLPLPDGDLLFATAAPSLTLLDPAGRVRERIATVIGDFRDGQRQLQVSEDGQVISLPMARGGASPRAFSIPELDLPPLDARLVPPRIADPGFRLDGLSSEGTGAAMGASVRINGRALEIHPADRVTAHALSHDGAAVFLGTMWRALRLDRSGAPVWRQEFSTEVRALNATGNGAFVVVTLADGTVRWLRQADGQEVLAFFAHGNGHDWVLWRPDGYYASSEEGDQYVGWHVNRGMDEAPDFYRAVQFERVFYRPDLLRAALNADAGVRSRGAGLMADLAAMAPARISVEDAQTRINARGRVEITLRLSALARELPMQQLAVYVNGLPVTPTRERGLSGADRMRLQRSVTVESDARENEIRIETDHGRSLGLAETYAQLPPTTPLPLATTARGRLFVVAIGINRFVNVSGADKDRLQDLEFAAQDARAFADAMRNAAPGLFREVKAVLLNDDAAAKPDRQEIRRALAGLQEAGPDDTVMVFLASHGFSDRAGNYFFMARDGQYRDVRTVVESDSAVGAAPSLVEGEEVFAALRQVAGRRLLFVDTCHARRIEGLVDTHSLAKRSAASSLAFMVAAKGNEDSQEYAPAGHGLFTHALLESLKPAADRDGDGVVRLREAFEHLAPIVQRLRARGLRQTPQLVAPSVLMNQGLALVAN